MNFIVDVAFKKKLHSRLVVDVRFSFNISKVEKERV